MGTCDSINAGSATDLKEPLLQNIHGMTEVVTLDDLGHVDLHAHGAAGRGLTGKNTTCTVPEIRLSIEARMPSPRQHCRSAGSRVRGQRRW
jgi:hypothetical protein